MYVLFSQAFCVHIFLNAFQQLIHYKVSIFHLVSPKHKGGIKCTQLSVNQHNNSNINAETEEELHEVKN